MSNPVLNQCWPLKMPPTAKAVLISMADQADDAGYCWPSIQTLSDRTCISKRAVIDAIKWLERSAALLADRTNGRHTKYQLTPAAFTACPTRSIRSEARTTGADAAPVPVQMPHQCTTRTSADAAPTGADAAPVPVQMPHQPVQMPHTNPQEPPIEPSITPKPRTKRPASDSPDGFAEFWAEYPRREGRTKAAESWVKRGLASDSAMRERVMDVLAKHRISPQWTKDNGQFIPHASTWLNQERYLDDVRPSAQACQGPHAAADDYWTAAGFTNRWEAENERCWAHNAHTFRDGKKLPSQAEVSV